MINKSSNDTLVGCALLGLILVMLVPLSPFVLDMLLTISIALSVITLLLTLFCEETLEFSSFPSLLLFLTLYRLALNIASTRMILTDGVAGDVIETFGEFVTAGSPLIGLVLFSLLTLINFIVITKGAGRIAEVSARFTLEALPGKQMAIDAEVNNNQLSHEAAKVARKELMATTEFYGAMDGASKFIRGDAIAGIIIAAINIFGGLSYGLLVKHESLGACFNHYTVLTIGDGLVTQIPALLISIAAGLLLTRNSKEKLSATLLNQLFAHSKALIICGAILLAIGCIPGAPKLIMWGVAAFLFVVAYKMRSQKEQKTENPIQEKPRAQLENAWITQPIIVEMGIDQLDLTEPLLKALPQIRQEIADEIGFVIPSVNIKDNLTLGSNLYAIKIKGASCFIGNEETAPLLHHLKREIIKNAHRLVTRQDVTRMLAFASESDAAVVEELIPHKISLGQIVKVVQNLLKEGLPINDFVSILEIIADHLAIDKVVDPEVLTERVRHQLSSRFLTHLFGNAHVLHAVTLDPKVEQMIIASSKRGEFGAVVALRPATIAKIDLELKKWISLAKEQNIQPMVLTSVTARRSLALLLDKYLPTLPVLSFEEVGVEKEIRTLGTISNEVLI